MARRKKQNEDQPNENPENINSESDDTFGLPEIEYEPLKREESETKETSEQEPVYSAREEERAPEPLSEAEHVEEETVEEHPEYRSSYYEDRPPVWPRVLGIALVLLLAAGVVWYFVSYRPEQQKKAEEARIAEANRVEAARKRDEERQAELRRQEAEQRRLDSLANAQPKEGVIETLSDRTGRYYVVVASAIDDDLLMDFAQKLSKKGTNSKLIPPFGRHKFFRLAVDVKDSYADAQSTADGMKGGDFGDQVWVIRY